MLAHAAGRVDAARSEFTRAHRTTTSRSPLMALPEELDQRLEQRLSLVETPEYEGEQMTQRDYLSVLLLCAVLPVLLLVLANVLL
jgi:hypothetical protein